MPEAYSKPHKKSKLECFAKIINTEKLLCNFAKQSIFDGVLNTLLDAEIYLFHYF